MGSVAKSGGARPSSAAIAANRAHARAKQRQQDTADMATTRMD